MSEEAILPVQVHKSNGSEQPVTAGGLLRIAREREGLHIAALAVSMKVPVKKLEALEADRLDLLPDAVFARALASSVCRTLKLDPAPVLRLLPVINPNLLMVSDRAINTPFDSLGSMGNISWLNLLVKPPVLMVVLLMIAAMGIYFYPQAARDFSANEKLYPAAPLTAPSGASELIETLTVTNETFTKPGLVATDLSTVLAPSRQTTVPDAVTPALPVKLGQLGTNTAQSASMNDIAKPLIDTSVVNATATATADAVLQFKANGLAWVQVTDVKGVQLLSRTLQPGETVSVAGALPLSVVVGRADLTTVVLRGKPFDLSTISQNNVARFEVKL